MTEAIQVGDIRVELTRKAVKHVHLSVHPPEGRVTLVAPLHTRTEVARAFAITKLGWIRKQQGQFHAQARETPREFVERETHYLWGRRYLLSLRYEDVKPYVAVDHRRIAMTVRPGSSRIKRAEVLHAWQRYLLHRTIPPLIQRWEPRLGVGVDRYFLQRMKTKWGSCNARRRHIRLNTELVKKPRDLLEYVIVHEMLHILEPKHSERFFELLETHYAAWRNAQAELNELPLAAETWEWPERTR